MSLMKLIYIVEDHQIIREGVRKYLELEHYNVLTFADLKSAREAFEKKIPSLLIQDVMLPDGDGFDFVREIRRSSDVPVIFMTAKVSEEDRIRGLELGADDYITKPFSLRELVLRVNAIFRRTAVRTEASPVAEKRFFVSRSDRMLIDFHSHRVVLNDNDVSLTSAEWKILRLLVDNCGKPVSRLQIIRECFGYESESYLRIADTHIKNLRAKLGGTNWIATERSIGYRFIGDEA